MSAAFKLAIVIVNYRTSAMVIDCLHSLAGAGALPPGTRIVVVDAASGDGSADALSAAITQNSWGGLVSLLPLDINGGFSYGNNRGLDFIRRTFGRPDYVLLLNPDTVVRPRGLNPLVAFLDARPGVGIAGSRLEDPDGTPQACAFRFPSIASEFEGEAAFGPITRLLRRWRVIAEVADAPVAVDWVSGASMMVRSEVFDDIGMFDEDYFLYYEEVDFTLRAARANWACWHVPASRVVHLVGQSTGVTARGAPPARRPAYWFQSRRRYFVKARGRVYAAAADLAWIAGTAVGALWRRLSGRKPARPPHLVHDFLRHSVLAGRYGFKSTSK